jgi:DNA-nicking Smr family endonuclease
MEGRVRKRLLSEEELDLWARVTRHDEPLARARPRDAGETEAPAVARTAPAAVPQSSTPIASSPAHQIPGTLPLSAKDRPVHPPLPAPFDPRVSKRIARGRREIDARLDLHGLRQQDAYAALRRFLARCQAEGHRHVLVITGKGGETGDFAERDFWNAGERGVLRRLVPHWLSEPAFRLHVVSYTESALKHGGSGALYVTIRKGPRNRKP